MITLKSPREIDIMGRAGRIVAGTLARMREILRPGISTEDLDAEAERFIRSHDGAVPSFKGLYGFPKTLCTSIDEEIVHGIPSPRRVLEEGSIVSVDVGVQLEGLHADSATTLPVGQVTDRDRRGCCGSRRNHSPPASPRPTSATMWATSGMRSSGWLREPGTAWCANWSATASVPSSTRSLRSPTTVVPSGSPGCSRE